MSAQNRISKIAGHLLSKEDLQTAEISECSEQRSKEDLDAFDFYKLSSLLSPKERSIQLKAREFAVQEIEPIINDFYEKAAFPFDIIPKYAKLNFIGADIPSYGSANLSAVECGLIAFELAKVSVDLATFFGILQNISMSPIWKCGNEEQKKRFLPKMASLELIGCFGLTEPSAGSDASGLHSTAKKVEGGWILNGEKRWIGNGTFADVIIIWARDESTNEVTGFIVEPKRVTDGSLVRTKIENKTAVRCVQNANIKYTNMFVPDENHLSLAKNFKTGPGASLFLTRAIASWIAAGATAGAYNKCLHYLKNRKQFGAPLAQFQLIQDKLVTMCSTIQSMWLTSWQVSKLYDQKLLTFGQVSMAKTHNTTNGRKVISLAREMMGGNGIVTDYHVGRAFLDIEAVHTYEGTETINSLIAAREITGMAAFKPSKSSKEN